MVSKEYLDKVSEKMGTTVPREVSEEELEKMYYEAKHCGKYSVYQNTIKLLALIKLMEK